MENHSLCKKILKKRTNVNVILLEIIHFVKKMLIASEVLVMHYKERNPDLKNKWLISFGIYLFWIIEDFTYFKEVK